MNGTGTRGLVLDDLLAVEADGGVLDFRFHQDEMLIWPFVRAQLFLGAVMEAYALSAPHAPSEPLTPGKLLRYGWHSAVRSPFRQAGPTEIVMFVSGIGNVEHDGVYFNRLHEHFAGESPEQTLLIEDSVRKTYRRPRSFARVTYNDGIQVMARVQALINPARAEDEQQISALITFLRERFPHKFKIEPWAQLDGYLNGLARRLPFLQSLYMRLLERLQPRILFQEDGSYGTRSYILKWAKAQGIRTAEFQHGSVSRNHIAYNYAESMRRSAEFCQHLPDHYLTYGEYWSEVVRTPSECYVVGNPYLTEQVGKEDKVSRDPDRRTVLITSGGMIPEELCRLVEEVVAILGPERYRFVFRAHPGEVPYVPQRYGHLAKQGVTLDLSTNLYRALRQADIVVGDASTVLYEALAFGKEVYVLNDRYSRLHVEETVLEFVTDARDLADKIANRTPREPLAVSRLFAGDWRARYREFKSLTKVKD